MTTEPTTTVRPIPRIFTQDDLQVWQTSESYQELVEFVESLAISVRGKKITDDVTVSPAVTTILQSLDQVESLISQYPVVNDREVSRFGKFEFRDFYDGLDENKEQYLSHIQDLGDLVLEVAIYFLESWGNRTRIDYGSGHELNFICFLLCLRKLGIVTEKDNESLVLRVFQKYLSIMRLLQTEYWLEPAGSHGVWGLDDYHFLPFLFGAAQLSNHEYLKPKSIRNVEVVEEMSKDYFYFECINFINTVKTESLRWNSPMLDDISSVKSWKKVEEGMFKMFKGEVLNKLPIMQHFLFGSLITCPEGITNSGPTGVEEHVHAFGDCCGIKVPAAFGAHSHKPLPFD